MSIACLKFFIRPLTSILYTSIIFMMFFFNYFSKSSYLPNYRRAFMHLSKMVLGLSFHYDISSNSSHLYISLEILLLNQLQIMYHEIESEYHHSELVKLSWQLTGSNLCFKLWACELWRWTSLNSHTRTSTWIWNLAFKFDFNTISRCFLYTKKTLQRHY